MNKGNFNLIAFKKYFWSSNTRAIYNDFLWFCPSCLDLIIDCILNKFDKYLPSLQSNLVILSFFVPCFIFDLILEKLVLVYFSVMLCQVIVFCCCKSNKWFSSLFDYVYSNNHCFRVAFAQFDPKQILFHLCIHLP